MKKLLKLASVALILPCICIMGGGVLKKLHCKNLKVKE